MNLIEALKALDEGKKIRRKGWFAKAPYQLKDGVLNIGNRWCAYLALSTSDLHADDWEVVEEAYITKDEKDYLENLLRIYRDDYDFTFEKVTRNEHLYLKIALIPYKEDEAIEYMFLPLFGINKPMFEGLEENDYEADDLKLFKE